MSKGVEYRGGYKYQLVSEYTVETGIKPDSSIDTAYIKLNAEGGMWLNKGYAWDGPSGPTFDTKNFMRGSLVHDAFYQLMREEHLSKDKWRKPADKLLKQMCLEDGMSRIRAWWVYRGVRGGGDLSASPESRKEIHRAP